MAAAEVDFTQLMQALWCSDVECLRGKPAEELLYYSQALYPPATQDSWDSSRWSPVVDGDFLTGHPAELLRNGSVADVPILLGTNKDEGVSFQSYSHTGLDPYPPNHDMNKTAFTNWAIRNFGSEALPKIVKLYPVPSHYVDFYHAAESIIGDYMMTCPNRRFARWHCDDTPNSTFVYSFDETPGHNQKEPTGVFHGAEIRFVFFDGVELDNWDEKALSESMVRYWTNFASSGDPNYRQGEEGHASVLVPWKPFENNQSYAQLELPTIIPRGALKQVQCDFWDSMPYLFR